MLVSFGKIQKKRVKRFLEKHVKKLLSQVEDTVCIVFTPISFRTDTPKKALQLALCVSMVFFVKGCGFCAAVSKIKTSTYESFASAGPVK